MDTPSLPSNFDDLSETGDEERDYERIWRLLQRTGEERAEAFDVDEEWSQLANRLDLEGTEAKMVSTDDSSTMPSRRAPDRASRSSDAAGRAAQRRWTRRLTIAALIFCLIGGGILWSSQPVAVTADAGERTQVSLPDGSTVQLNGGTTLEYVRGFSSLPLIGSSTRWVRLKGEAFFSVVEGQRPFRVETRNARVEVLGTAFNVRARSQGDTPETHVTLTSGRVQVQSAPGGASDPESVVLDERGQVSQVRGRSTGPTEPQNINLKYVQAWRNGGFGLADASLPTILRELEYRFGTSLQLEVPVAKTDTMTLHYARDGKLEDVLRDVCIVQGLTYRETSQGYELVRK